VPAMPHAPQYLPTYSNISYLINPVSSGVCGSCAVHTKRKPHSAHLFNLRFLNLCFNYQFVLLFDTLNPPKNIIFWKISVIFWGTVKAGHKITSLIHDREFPLPAALPRQPLVRSLSVLSRSRYCAARNIACKPFHIDTVFPQI
jgi:hypothetical protein